MNGYNNILLRNFLLFNGVRSKGSLALISGKEVYSWKQ